MNQLNKDTMRGQKLKKYFLSPMFGLFIFAIQIILQTYVLPLHFALITSLLILICSEWTIRKIFSTRLHSSTFYITAIALIAMAIACGLAGQSIKSDYTYIVIGEIVIVLELMVLRIAKTFFKKKYFQQRNFLEKTLLNGYFNTTAILRYALTVHIFSIVIYRQLTEGYVNNELIDQIIYVIIPLVIILALSIHEILQTNTLIKKLESEEWLPIVTEEGNVSGRISKTVSKNSKNKYMHPVVRVALVCNGKIYLQERNNTHILDAGKIDHPFEKYMLFKHEVNEAVNNCIRMKTGTKINNKPNFTLKYTFENEITKRLIFLYTIEIENEFLVTNTKQMTGKFWTVKQIEDNFSSKIFSECFEQEYDYLKHIILLKNTDYLIASNPNGPTAHSDILLK